MLDRNSSASIDKSFRLFQLNYFHFNFSITMRQVSIAEKTFLKPYLSRGSSKIRGRCLELASYLQGLKCAFVTCAIKAQFHTSYCKLIMRFSVMWRFNCQLKAFISELFHSLEKRTFGTMFVSGMIKYPEGSEQKQLTKNPSTEELVFATKAQQCRSLIYFYFLN